MSAVVLKVACESCGRLFGKDEHAWASDWKVCTAPNWVWHIETRYTCDSCHTSVTEGVTP